MLVGRTGLSRLMVGRSGPLNRLLALVAAAGATGERPTVALVSGDPGIGKTRLLRELIAALPEGTPVLAGQAEPGSLGRPWDLVQAALGHVPEGGDDRLRNVVNEVLGRLGARPALLVFEDLHWADAESVSVFDRLAASAPPTLVLVATYRPDELSRRLPGGEMLERLERRQQVHHLRLDPLTRSQTASFLAAIYGCPVTGATVAAVHQRTGGNPFFLEEIVAAAGDADPESLVRQPLPWSLADLVRRQLEGLGPEERRVVEAAAVLGSHAGFDTLAAMLHASEDELIGHLRMLVQRGLLVEEADDEFRFRHALVRESVQGQLLGRERRRLHEQALAALTEACCADLAALARHAQGAGHFDQFVALARDGARHYLTTGSPYQALALATEALAEAPDDPVLLGVAAHAGWLLGLNSEALERAEHWREVVAGADAEARARADRVLGRLYHELDRLDDLWRVVAEVEALADVVPAGRERASCLAFVAQIRMLQGQNEEAIRVAEAAADEAEAAGAKDVRAQALVERASALAHTKERRGEARDAMAQAVADARAVGDFVLVARGLNNLVDVMGYTHPGMPELLAGMREAADRSGFDAMVQDFLILHTASWAVAVGDAAAARRAIAQAAELGPTARRAVMLWQRGLQTHLMLEAGRTDEAADCLAALRASATASPQRGEHWCAELAFRLAAQQGDGDAANGALRQLPPPEPGTSPESALDHVVLMLTAAARVGVDRELLATALLEPAGPLALELAGAAAVVEGMVAVIDGDSDTAAALLAEGLASPAATLLTAPVRAQLGLALARALAATGRRHDALAAITAAQALVERWPGLTADALDALEQRLRAVPGEDGELTAREREVAALLAEGLSNAELARRLYISPKTAAVHVSNILMKLGMSSRAEVAAWAVRTGLATGVRAG